MTGTNEIDQRRSDGWSGKVQSDIRMSRTTTYGYLEVVTSPADLKGVGVRAGDRGTVVEVLERPEPAVMVEYADEEGRTKALVIYSPDLTRLLEVLLEPS